VVECDLIRCTHQWNGHKFTNDVQMISIASDQNGDAEIVFCNHHDDGEVPWKGASLCDKGNGPFAVTQYLVGSEDLPRHSVE